MNSSIPPFSWAADKSNTNLLYSRIWVTDIKDLCSPSASCSRIEWQQCRSAHSSVCLPHTLSFSSTYSSVLALFQRAVCTSSCLFHAFPSSFLSSAHLFCPLPVHHYLLFLRSFSEIFKQLKFPGFTLAGQSNCIVRILAWLSYFCAGHEASVNSFLLCLRPEGLFSLQKWHRVNVALFHQFPAAWTVGATLALHELESCADESWPPSSAKHCGVSFCFLFLNLRLAKFFSGGWDCALEMVRVALIWC